jgi:type II secretory pathway pseudopilin PulG
MHSRQLSPEQKSKIKKQEDRQRRKRRQREDEYRRHIERLRRQIEQARKRRQRLMLLLLLAVLAMQEAFLAAIQRSFTYQPYDPDPKNWTPDPFNDYAPQPGSDDHIDGYSREQWTRMTAERGIQISRKAELKAEWEADPEREDFPQRYKDWGYRPYIGEIMYDLTDTRHQNDALIAIKLMAPTETHKYLNEAYAADPGDLRQCLADRDHQIIATFQQRAILWEERKRREAEEAKREQELSRKNDDDQGIPEPN